MHVIYYLYYIITIYLDYTNKGKNNETKYIRNEKKKMIIRQIFCLCFSFLRYIKKIVIKYIIISN